MMLKMNVYTLFQMANAAFFSAEAYFLFLPSIWIVLAVIFFEGLMGGGAYVNSFYAIREEVHVNVFIF